MTGSSTGNAFFMIAVFVFVAVLLLMEGLYLLWNSYRGPEAQQIKKRLKALSASNGETEQARLLKQTMLSEVPILERVMLTMPSLRNMDTFIRQSGLDWTVSRLLLTSFALGIAGVMFTTSMAHQLMSVGLAAGAVLACLPVLYVWRERSRRLSRMEMQLPDALDLMARALRAGHAFPISLQMAGDEMAEPIAAEFRIVHDEINFGTSLQQALSNLCERVPITDLRYFVVSVLIQRESGGNLTEVLSNLSRLIRERMKLLAKVKVLSSEGRLSAWILTVMPFCMAALLNWVNPEFMVPLWHDPIGIAILKYTLTMMVIGVFVVRKIVRLRV